MTEETSYERLCREAEERGLTPGLRVSKLRFRRKLDDQSVLTHRKVNLLVLTDEAGEVVKRAEMSGIQDLERAAEALLFET